MEEENSKHMKRENQKLYNYKSQVVADTSLSLKKQSALRKEYLNYQKRLKAVKNDPHIEESMAVKAAELQLTI